VNDGVDRVHHVIGGKRIAVLERHALAQREIDGGGINLLPGRRQRRLDLQRGGIAIDQAVERLEGHDHAGALRVVIGIDIRNGVTPGDPERIGRFLREGRRRGCKRHACRGEGAAKPGIRTH